MIVVVAGVAGCGKSTVGQLLARRLGWLFADGDSFHSAANIAKMRAGQPLTDSDRQPWLAALGGWMDEVQARGESAVLACSALMVFLTMALEQGEARLHARRGHFFGEPLLASQFAVLEPPDPSERQVYPV